MFAPRRLLSVALSVVALMQSTAYAQGNAAAANPNAPKNSPPAAQNNAAGADALPATPGQFRRLSHLLNSGVVLKNGDAAGTISDFVVGPQGTLDYAVATNGDQFYTIPYPSLMLNANKQVQLNLSGYEYQSLPFFTANQWPNFQTSAFQQRMGTLFGTGINDGFSVGGQPNTAGTPQGVGIPYGNDALSNGNSVREPRGYVSPDKLGAANSASAATGANGQTRSNGAAQSTVRDNPSRTPGSITGTSGTKASPRNGANGLNPRPAQAVPNRVTSAPLSNGALPNNGTNVPANSGTPSNPTRNPGAGAATGGPALGGAGSNTSGTGAATGGPAIGGANGAATGGPVLGNPGSNASGTGTATGGPAIGGNTGGGAGGGPVGGGSGPATGGAAPR